MAALLSIGRLFEKSATQASRSSALGPVIGLFCLLLPAGLIATYFSAPLWVVVGIFSICGVMAALFVFAYLYFMFRNPDALRSEKYNIQKLAIEQGVLGDDTRGIIDVETTTIDDETVKPVTKPREIGGD